LIQKQTVRTIGWSQLSDLCIGHSQNIWRYCRLFYLSQFMSEKKQFQLSVMSLWVGILIPILAAFIPFGMKYISPEHRLEYTIVGPIAVKGTKSISVKIQNGGERLEKNVRLALRISYLGRLDANNEDHNIVAVDTQTPAKVEREGDWTVIYLGDLRPKESMEVSAMSEHFEVSLYRTLEPSGITIKSEENLAQYIGSSELAEYIYPFGFWMFVILMVLIFIAAIYQDRFMDPKKREELILKEIDKLPKDRG